MDTNSIKLAAAASTGMILGSTVWASVAVMPSLIAANLSSHSKLSVFDGLIVRANRVLPPIFLTTTAALAYLSYATRSPLPASTTFSSSVNYGIGAACMALAVALQSFIVPLNTEMQNIVVQGKFKGDDGKEADRRISQLWTWNLGRVVLSAVAFSISLVELQTITVTRS